jgi:hypothetical protein
MNAADALGLPSVVHGGTGQAMRRWSHTLPRCPLATSAPIEFKAWRKSLGGSGEVGWRSDCASTAAYSAHEIG